MAVRWIGDCMRIMMPGCTRSSGIEPRRATASESVDEGRRCRQEAAREGGGRLTNAHLASSTSERIESIVDVIAGVRRVRSKER